MPPHGYDHGRKSAENLEALVCEIEELPPRVEMINITPFQWIYSMDKESGFMANRWSVGVGNLLLDGSSDGSSGGACCAV